VQLLYSMKNVVFWDVALCTSCVNRRFGGTYHLRLQSRAIRERGTSVSRWLQTGPTVGNNQLYKNRESRSVGHVGNQQRGEGQGLGEGQKAGRRGMSVSGRVSVRGGERTTQGHIPQDILHSHPCENLKSYILYSNS
jgi:hypothetical protein